MLASLSPDQPPQLRNPYDALAVFAHAAMLSVGFRLVGLGEEHKIEADSSEQDTKALPNEWNATMNSTYAFRYKHTQSALEYLVKVSRMGSKSLIHALAIQDDKVHGFDIVTNDFLSSSSFPYTVPPSDNSTTTRTRSIQDLFISRGRLGDLWALFKINVVQKIAPSLSKHEEAEDNVDAERQAQEEGRHGQPARSGQPSQPTRPHDYDPLRDDRDRLPPMAQPRPYLPGGDPLAPEQPRPHPGGEMRPPGWEDEYDVLRAPGRGGAGGRLGNIGDRDLYPQGLGPHDPLRIGGPGGFGPRGGGGMHPTRDDFDPFGGDQGFGDMRAPPGARFDPPFPGQGPPRGSGGFGGPGGFGGGYGGGFGGGGII